MFKSRARVAGWHEIYMICDGFTLRSCSIALGAQPLRGGSRITLVLLGGIFLGVVVVNDGFGRGGV